MQRFEIGDCVSLVIDGQRRIGWVIEHDGEDRYVVRVPDNYPYHFAEIRNRHWRTLKREQPRETRA